MNGNIDTIIIIVVGILTIIIIRCDGTYFGLNFWGVRCYRLLCLPPPPPKRIFFASI